GALRNLAGPCGGPRIRQRGTGLPAARLLDPVLPSVGRTHRRFPDCGDDPGADPSSTEDDAVATPAHVRGPTRSGRGVRLDLQSLLHPRRLRRTRSSPPPTGTRIRTTGGGPELHGV